jgi:HlyD family secretion protein
MRGTIVVIVAIVLVGIGAYSYLGTSDSNNLRADEPIATPLPVVPVDERIVVDAVVAPARHVALSMASSGLVAEILVREGEVVTANQLIARLDSSQELVAIKQATARLQGAEAEYAALKAGARPQEIVIAQAALDIAAANLSKLTDAPPNSALTALDTRVSMSIAEAELRKAQAELELKELGDRAETLAAAAAAVNEAQAELEEHELALATTELRAPFTGTVAALDLEVGEQIMAGDPVAHLADFRSWQIQTDGLTELNVVHVTEGMSVTVTVDAIPDLVLNGTLLRIRPLGENKLGQITYTALVQLDQADPRLRWNMTAAVIITPQ